MMRFCTSLLALLLVDVSIRQHTYSIRQLTFCTSLLALLVLKLLVLKYFYDKGNENMCYDGAE